MGATFYRVLFGVSLLALTSCATFYPFDYYVLREGPVPIDPEWTEIHCTDVVKTTLPEKELWLLLPQPLDVPDYRDRVAVSSQDGKRVEIYAEIVDSDGKVYPLPVWMTRAMIAGRPREGTYMRLSSRDLPRTLRLTTVRLRSSSPITLSEVLWTAGRSPGARCCGLD